MSTDNVKPAKKGLGLFLSLTNLAVIFWTTLIGGFISSLVKWGSEVNMPPRVAGEISPPGAHIDAWGQAWGVTQHSLDYVYQGNSVLGAVTLYHWLFSFIFSFIYVVWSMYQPRIRALYGAVYGLLITAWAHWLMIPLLGFRKPVYADGATGWAWNLNWQENLSEILGHIYWSFSIEICLIAVLAICGRPWKGDWVKR